MTDKWRARARVPLRFLDSKVRQGETYLEIPSPLRPLLARPCARSQPTLLLALQPRKASSRTQNRNLPQFATVPSPERNRGPDCSQGCGGGESGGCSGSQLVDSSAIWGKTAAPGWLIRREKMTLSSTLLQHWSICFNDGVDVSASWREWVPGPARRCTPSQWDQISARNSLPRWRSAVSRTPLCLGWSGHTSRSRST